MSSFDNPFAACGTTEHSDAKQLEVTCGVCKGPLFGGILGESNPPLRNEPCLALSKRARRFKQFFSTFAACFAAFLALSLSSFAFLSSSQSSACPFLRVRFEVFKLASKPASPTRASPVALRPPSYTTACRNHFHVNLTSLWDDHSTSSQMWLGVYAAFWAQRDHCPSETTLRTLYEHDEA